MLHGIWKGIWKGIRGSGIGIWDPRDGIWIWDLGSDGIRSLGLGIWWDLRFGIWDPTGSGIRGDLGSDGICVSQKSTLHFGQYKSVFSNSKTRFCRQFYPPPVSCPLLTVTVLSRFKTYVFCCHSLPISDRHRATWLKTSAFCFPSLFISDRHRAVWLQYVRVLLSFLVHLLSPPRCLAQDVLVLLYSSSILTANALSGFKTSAFCCRSLFIC